MATNSKSKSNGNPAKTNVQNEAKRQPNNTSGRQRPTEEQIREKAREIYYQRLHKGEAGNELEDWQKAEKMLSES